MNLKLFSNRFRDNFFLLSMFFVLIVSVQAQKKISGTVVSGGVALPSANVLVKGTTTGVSTDIDGKFSFTVPSNAQTLVVSYLGYATKEVAITSGDMKISLVEEKNSLEEVVVNVGYGTQKKSVVTGAISKVTAKDLEKVPNGRIEQALQGRTSGITIASNAGQPGSSATVRVRGITTFDTYGGNNPIWVIDGIIVNNEGIGVINQSDIESIEVLKDAASLAIYGSRAASGVILVTTKKGKKGKISVTYNGFGGVSSPAKTLKLLNATEYGTLMNERFINGGNSGTVPYPNLSALGTGTDWQKAIFSNNAYRNNHEISVSGAGDNSNFYLSFGSQYQEGIVLPQISNYSKKNIRLNSNHKINNWISIGETIGYTHQKSVGVGNTNSEYGGPLSSAINLDPITPLVVTDPVVANSSPYTTPYVIRDENGNPYGISSVIAGEMTNPLAYAKTKQGQHGWSDDFIGNVFVELSPIKDIKFKSTLGTKLAFFGYEGFTPNYYLNANSNNISSLNSLFRRNNRSFSWNIENTALYTKKINNHNFSVLLGQGAYKENQIYTEAGVTYSGLPTNDFSQATFNGNNVLPANKTGYSFDLTPHIVSSLFSRLTYDFKEKYLFSGIIRRDGSSRFGSNKKYGVFPSFSLGWVASKEGFWKQNNYINNLKIRGGYGVTGNDAIPDFGYLALIEAGRNYTIGNTTSVLSGSSPGRIANPDLHWEETAQTNVGFETKLLNDFNLTFDWYKKVTTGILRDNPVPGYVGAEAPPLANIANMNNSGIEIELGYKKKIKSLNFSANANFSTLKNEVTFLGTGTDFITTLAATFQSMEPADGITRTQVGEAYNSFYGFQTMGIFQNQAEINAYTNSTGGLIQPNAKPGDFRWEDINGDGMISDNDRKFLGSPLPKYTFGLTLNADYRGFDVMLFAQGVAGNKIFQGLRRSDLGGNNNYQADALNRWHGEGTSNDYPRLTTDDTNKNFSRMSDFYLQKGDYLRLKIVQLGYSLPISLINKVGLQKLRLYVSGENLYTLTKYTGFDPEIGGNVMGIDRGYYPQARSIMFGANLQF